MSVKTINRISKDQLLNDNTLIAVSIFSGGGGLDLGFSAAGFQIACSTDIDGFSCETLKINQGKSPFYSGHKVIEGDIRSMEGDQLLNGVPEKVDVLIGGPPCQSFSVNGKRKGLDDPRGDLIWEFLRLIDEIRPKVFVFENVIGLKTVQGGEVITALKKELALNGEYVVSEHIYEMADYGIPQFRKRLFLIGVLGGEIVPPMSTTHGNDFFSEKPYATVKKVLENMPKPSDQIANHVGRKHSARIVDRYSKLAFGERDSKTRINKLNPATPSFTIVVGSDQGGGKGHVHPYQPREVTPRESARMQTFPDWWEFFGTGRHVIRQVGNAVPPLFAALLADHIRQHVFRSTESKTVEQYSKLIGIEYLT